MSTIDWSARLTRYFQHYNPRKVGTVREMLKTYAGREEAYLSALIQKYGPEPPENGEATTPLRGETASSTRVETPRVETPRVAAGGSTPSPPATLPPASADAGVRGALDATSAEWATLVDANRALRRDLRDTLRDRDDAVRGLTRELHTLRSTHAVAGAEWAVERARLARNAEAATEAARRDVRRLRIDAAGERAAHAAREAALRADVADAHARLRDILAHRDDVDAIAREREEERKRLAERVEGLEREARRRDARRVVDAATQTSRGGASRADVLSVMAAFDDAVGRAKSQRSLAAEAVDSHKRAAEALEARINVVRNGGEAQNESPEALVIHQSLTSAKAKGRSMNDSSANTSIVEYERQLRQLKATAASLRQENTRLRQRAEFLETQLLACPPAIPSPTPKGK